MIHVVFIDDDKKNADAARLALAEFSDEENLSFDRWFSDLKVSHDSAFEAAFADKQLEEVKNIILSGNDVIVVLDLWYAWLGDPAVYDKIKKQYEVCDYPPHIGETDEEREPITENQYGGLWVGQELLRTKSGGNLLILVASSYGGQGATIFLKNKITDLRTTVVNRLDGNFTGNKQKRVTLWQDIQRKWVAAFGDDPLEKLLEKIGQLDDCIFTDKTPHDWMKDPKNIPLLRDSLRSEFGLGEYADVLPDRVMQDTFKSIYYGGQPHLSLSAAWILTLAAYLSERSDEGCVEEIFEWPHKESPDWADFTQCYVCRRTPNPHPDDGIERKKHLALSRAYWKMCRALFEKEVSQDSQNANKSLKHCSLSKKSGLVMKFSWPTQAIAENLWLIRNEGLKLPLQRIKTKKTEHGGTSSKALWHFLLISQTGAISETDTKRLYTMHLYEEGGCFCTKFKPAL